MDQGNNYEPRNIESVSNFLPYQSTTYFFTRYLLDTTFSDVALHKTRSLQARLVSIVLLVNILCRRFRVYEIKIIAFRTMKKSSIMGILDYFTFTSNDRTIPRFLFFRICDHTYSSYRALSSISSCSNHQVASAIRCSALFISRRISSVVICRYGRGSIKSIISLASLHKPI